MADRPILFSAPMVRALLAGMKTQTRRILKPQPDQFRLKGGDLAEVSLMHLDGDPLPRITVGCVITLQEVRFVVGDRLWARETWAVASVFSDVVEVRYRASERASHSEFVEQIPIAVTKSAIATWPKWKPAIHMPRWASRLTLTVTDVRVQRLQDISTRDVNAEGIDTRQYRGAGQAFDQWAVNQYAALWDEINGPDAWAKNPWIVAISFSPERRNSDTGRTA